LGKFLTFLVGIHELVVVVAVVAYSAVQRVFLFSD
jgi:hypothetical protein